MQRVVSLLIVFVAVQSAGYESDGADTINPIRKVVTMLQSMQEKVKEEGNNEAKLYDKFSCYCKTSDGGLTAEITAADGKIPQVESDIIEAENLKVQLESDIKQHSADKEAAKSTSNEATSVRKKEAAAFAKEKTSYDANINALDKAIKAILSGMSGSFVQTGTAQFLRRFVEERQDLGDFDRRQLVSFLSGAEGYVPKSGEVVGILKQLHEDMTAELVDITANEEAAKKTFRELYEAKKKQVGSLTTSIEQKMKRVGKLGVDIATMKDDLSDTQLALAEDRKFLAELEKNCASKDAEWLARKTTRAEELLAIAETIKVLNDDDALELFKKTLPSTSVSFVEVRARQEEVRVKMMQGLKQVARVDRRGVRPELDFLSLALQGKKVSFEKVLQMIDEMVTVLKTEQKDDDQKKVYCGAQFDSSDDKKKALERTVSDHENTIKQSNTDLDSVNSEIKSLEEGIKSLDKNVQEATTRRKEEHEDFTELISSDTTAKRLLNFAKNRLNQYYNPQLYKPKKARVLSAEDKIVESFGGEVPTAPPSGIAGTGIGFVQVTQKRDAPAPPPETFGAYASKGQENTGVIAMIDLLINDLDKDLTQARTQEENDQKEYEVTMTDAGRKRAADLKSLNLKQSAKASLEVSLSESTDEKASTTRELMANAKYIHSLHAECDWLLQYFDVRKAARGTEVDQLKEAKAILKGADFQ